MAKEKGLKVYYRSTPKLKGLYDALMGKLRSTDAFTARGRRTSNDAIVNALVLWANSREPEEVARMLLPLVDRFDGIWASLPAEDDCPRDVVNAEPDVPTNEPPRRARRKA